MLSNLISTVLLWLTSNQWIKRLKKTATQRYPKQNVLKLRPRLNFSKKKNFNNLIVKKSNFQHFLTLPFFDIFDRFGVKLKLPTS